MVYIIKRIPGHLTDIPFGLYSVLSFMITASAQVILEIMLRTMKPQPSKFYIGPIANHLAFHQLEAIKLSLWLIVSALIYFEMNLGDTLVPLLQHKSYGAFDF